MIAPASDIANKSFLLYGVKDTGFEVLKRPTITSEDEVIVEIKKTGICGSDVHYFCHGRIGDCIVEDPMVLGHESAGVVVEVGQNVPSTISLGVQVAVEPGVSCRHCSECRGGKYHLCELMVFAATPPNRLGTLCRYYKVPYELVYPLPSTCSLEDGALVEPLAVAVHALHAIAQLRPNQNVAVFGAGPVGLLCMGVARAFGARNILAIDVNPSRLEFAKNYAATETFATPTMLANEGSIDYGKRTVKGWNKPLRGPEAIDVVIEATGAETCVQMSCLLAKVGGTVVQVGMGKDAPQIPSSQVISKELLYKGSFRYGPGDYALAIGLVAAGKVDLTKLVTHRFAFEDAEKAFAAAHAGVGPDCNPVIKVIIDGPISLDVNGRP